MNPMKEFKESAKEFIIQGKKVLFKSLDNKELEEVNSSIKKALNTTDLEKAKKDPKYAEEFQTAVLAYCIKSIDGVLLSQFDDVVKDIKEGFTPFDAMKKEVKSWDFTMSSILFGYYLKYLDEKNKRYDKDLNFLRG